MNSCYICLDDTDTYIISNTCNCKIYSHKECINNWLQTHKTCIICKEEIPFRNLNIFSFYAGKELSKQYVTTFFNAINYYYYVNKINVIKPYFVSVLLYIIFSFINTFIIIIPFFLLVTLKSQVTLLYDIIYNYNEFMKFYKNIGYEIKNI